MVSANQGFTLVELIVTLVVAAIVVGLAVPSISNLIRTNSVISVSNGLFVDILFARSEAIKRNSPVTICAANADLTDCAGSGTSDWSVGWIAFVETTTFDGDVDDGETIIRTSAGPTSQTMTMRAVSDGAVQGHIGYLGNGYPVIPPTGTMPSWEFQICEDNDTNFSRQIDVNRTGRVQMVGEADACS